MRKNQWRRESVFISAFAALEKVMSVHSKLSKCDRNTHPDALSGTTTKLSGNFVVVTWKL